MPHKRHYNNANDAVNGVLKILKQLIFIIILT